MEYSFRNSKYTDQKRANKNNRLSDSIIDYEDVALEYFKDLDGNVRCALSGEILQEDNLSKEHIIALAIGGHDIAANIVPSAIGYNIIKNDIYLLKYLELQENQEGENIYNPYRLLKIVNYMLKSINARENEIDEYREVILTPNEIDEYLRNIEINDKQAIYPEKIAPKRGEASKIERNNQEIEYEGEGITIYTFISDVINKLRDENIILEKYIKQLENIFENTKENEVFKKLDAELEMRQEIISFLRDRNIENEYDIAYIMQRRVSSKEEIAQIIETTLKNISEILKQNDIDEEWASIVLENRPWVLIDNNEVENVIKTVEFLANESELDISLFEQCFDYNESVRKYIEIFRKLKYLGYDLAQINVSTEQLKSFIERMGGRFEEVGIDDFDIGCKIRWLRSGQLDTTLEEREELYMLGVLDREHLEKLNGNIKRKTPKTVKEYINIFRQLKNIELNLGEIRSEGDTLESFLSKNKISIDKLGIEDFDLSSVKRRMKKGKFIMNEDEINELYLLGILTEDDVKKVKHEMERKVSHSIEYYMDIFRKLRDRGMNLKELKTTDTLKSFAKRNGVLVKDLGIEDFNIGKVTSNIRSGNIVTSPKEQEELFLMGILEEKHINELNGEVSRRKQTKLSIYMEIFTKMQEMKLDFFDIELRKLDIRSIAAKVGIVLEEGQYKNYTLGKLMVNIRLGCFKMSEDEIGKLMNLGILTEENIKQINGINPRKKNRTANECIIIFRGLIEKGLDIKKINTKKDWIEGFFDKSEFIDIGIDNNFHLGNVVRSLRKGDTKTTEEERQELLNLGIFTEEHIKSLKQKDEEKAIKAMKKAVAKNVKDNVETRKNIQDQVMNMQRNNVKQHSQYQSIGR